MRLYTITEIPIPLETNKTLGYSNKDHRLFRMVFDEASTPNVAQLIDWVIDQKFITSDARKNGYDPNAFKASITGHYESYMVLQSNAGSTVPRLTHVDVRVYKKKDAELFLKTWVIPKEEYEKNKQYATDLEQRKSGYIRLSDGKQYPISELQPVPKGKNPTFPRVPSATPLGKELYEFIRNMKSGNDRCRSGDYWFIPDPPFNDFNRDICNPGDDDDCPEGFLAIRADDDFWPVAHLPYRFHQLSIEELVFILWPERYEGATFHGDHDDKEYWRSYFDKAKKRSEQESKKWKRKQTKKVKQEIRKMVKRKGPSRLKALSR